MDTTSRIAKAIFGPLPSAKDIVPPKVDLSKGMPGIVYPTILGEHLPLARANAYIQLIARVLRGHGEAVVVETNGYVTCIRDGDRRLVWTDPTLMQGDSIEHAIATVYADYDFAHEYRNEFPPL